MEATAPGVAHITQWFVAVRGPGQLALSYFGRRPGQSTYDAYLTDDTVRGFMAEHNPAALAETSRRFLEAIDRGLWRPRRNSAREDLSRWSGS